MQLETEQAANTFSPYSRLRTVHYRARELLRGVTIDDAHSIAGAAFGAFRHLSHDPCSALVGLAIVRAFTFHQGNPFDDVHIETRLIFDELGIDPKNKREISMPEILAAVESGELFLPVPYRAAI